MHNLSEYAYMWESKKDEYVLVKDETGIDIFKIGGEEILFVLIEDDDLSNQIVLKMLECGNKIYDSICELQKAIECG